MSDQRDGGIGWTDQTWNPVRGCSRVSPGCEHCYAETMAARFCGPGQPYEGLAMQKLKVIADDDQKVVPRWTGTVRLVAEHLADPLRWKRPRKVFVNSMSDLALLLRKFPLGPGEPLNIACAPNTARAMLDAAAEIVGTGNRALDAAWRHQEDETWPFPNVWLGVSVEDQQRADERIPHLLATPAAVRFLSCEPLLEPVFLRERELHGRFIECPDETQDEATDPCLGCDGFPRTGQGGGDPCGAVRGPKIDWVIVGGESGLGARPMDLGWARSLVKQCAAAAVPCFVKQLGSRPEYRWCGECGGTYDEGRHMPDRSSGLKLKDRKGADPAEWPEDLRVRQWPVQGAK